jgi:Family of unknown function (DUF6739)
MPTSTTSCIHPHSQSILRRRFSSKSSFLTRLVRTRRATELKLLKAYQLQSEPDPTPTTANNANANAEQVQAQAQEQEQEQEQVSGMHQLEANQNDTESDADKLINDHSDATPGPTVTMRDILRHNRLPSKPVPYDEEFPARTLWNRVRRGIGVTWRLAGISAKKIFDPRTLLVLGGTWSAVWLFALMEGMLLLKDPMLHFDFAWQYSLKNILPALVRRTHDMSLVISSLGGDPDAIMRVFDERNVDDSHALLKIQQFGNMRAVLASFMALGQVLRVVGIGFQSSTDYRDAILAGSEPPVHYGLRERVIRLAGSASDTTLLSLFRNTSHIIPVYENPDEVQFITKRFWYSGRYFVFWHVDKRKYGLTSSWENFSMHSDWMLPTVNGERILYIEADATNIEEALALGKHSTDLSLENATQAFRAIEAAAHSQHNVKFDRTMRVFLADSLQEIETGGGYTYTLREEVNELQEVDVLIDTIVPLLSEILIWCDRIAMTTKAQYTYEHGMSEQRATQESRKIVLHTRSREYFSTMKQILELYDFEVFDRYEKNRFDPFNTPRLIYQHTTAETVSSIDALMSRGLINADRVCVLFDSKGGERELERLCHRYPGATAPYSLCSAQIYDDLFRQVRVWTRLGYTPEQIQHELDCRLMEVFDRVDRI